uniref:Peptidase n=1 Tax=viral metagenome TaxID=1070528 RepID=A0A6H2A006_9ZZZZ
MPAIQVPGKLKQYGVRGIFVGGCVERGDGSSFRRKGHAHGDPGYELRWTGWICIRSAKRLWTPSGKPSQLLWHETAHIYRRSWTQKQCTQWANKMVRLQRDGGDDRT